MSLYSLEHPSLPVSISDELEAFFHVLLYNGVRFLLHSYPSIVAFVKNYFDGYDEARGRMFSPELKRTIVYQQAELVYCSERLQFLRPDGALHPINLVFSAGKPLDATSFPTRVIDVYITPDPVLVLLHPDAVRVRLSPPLHAQLRRKGWVEISAPVPVWCKAPAPL